MSMLSKLMGADLTIPFNCYEAIHTWHPDCFTASIQMSGHAFVQAVRIYGQLFLLSQTLSGRYDAKSFQQTLFNVLRSSSFLSLHAFLILYLACKFRWLSGRFYFPLIACLPGLLSGMAAVQVERSSRRSPLAFYVFNLASQSILTKVRIEMFDQTSNRTLSLIQLFTFAAASTYILQQSQTSGHSRDLVGSLLRWLLGPSIATTDLSSSNIDSCHLTASKHVSISLPARQTLRRLSLAFLRPLAAGASIQLLMQVLLKPALLSNPAGLWNRIASPGFFQVTYFAATYAFLFQTSQHVLSQFGSIDVAQNVCLSSLMASPAFLILPSTPLALYALWRACQIKCNLWFEQGRLTYRPFYANVIYAAATTYLFQAAFLEPNLIRPSYFRFLNQVTNQTLNKINRPLMASFMPNPSQSTQFELQPLDLQYVSRHYFELVHSWLLF